jgi:hypothetical protein
MSKQISPSTPEINRLRAAAALIPIIEAGLADSKLSVERAALMASFCEWTMGMPGNDAEASRLLKSIGRGLERIRVALSSSAKNSVS